MKENKPVRFGIIGAGVAAETHARELSHVSGARVEAVFARDPAKAERFRAAYSIAKAYSDIDLFLADEAIDIVIVATPNGLHKDYALAVAAAGKHGVLEKPLETTAARATEIIDAFEQAEKRLFVIYQRRHSNAARQAKEDIEHGRLGKLVLINIIDNEYRRPEYYRNDQWRGTKDLEGGGCVITQSTHLIDLVQYVAGPISDVFAKTATLFHDIDTEDTSVATFRFANGALGTLSSSTAAFPGLRHLIVISGTAGSIIFNGEHDQIVIRQTVGDAEVIGENSGFSFRDPIDPREYPTRCHRLQLQQITDSIAAGEAQPHDREEMLWALRVSDAIYRSAAEGAEIHIG